MGWFRGGGVGGGGGGLGSGYGVIEGGRGRRRRGGCEGPYEIEVRG